MMSPKSDTCLRIRFLNGAMYTGKEKQMKKRWMKAALAVCLSVCLLPGTGMTVWAEAAEELSVEKPVTDRAGNPVEIPEDVQKIISMAPSVTELLIDLGLSDKIIACDTYSGFSAFASALAADLPQFDMMAPDNEAIVALEPDIVFTTGMSYAGGDDVYAAVKNAGICVCDLPTAASLDDIKEDILFIGEAVGEAEAASSIVDKMTGSIEQLSELAGTIPEKKTVLYLMSVPTPDYPDIYTCGKGTYMDEIFSLVGAENIAGDIDFEWPTLSEEDILAKAPDVIIIGDTYTPDPVETVLALEGWESIPAIAEKQVFAIDGDAFNQPNQYVMNSACEIAKQIYPDIYADLSLPF